MQSVKLSIAILSIWMVAAPAGLAAESWRFIMTCDSRDTVTGVNEQTVSELVDEILRRDVDFVIFAGDLVYGARVGPERFEDQLWNWVRVMQPVYDAGIPVYVCRGNHEIGDMWDAGPGEPPDPLDNYARRWLDVFGNDDYPQLKLPDNGPDDEEYMSYSVVHKNALIVGLDQYAGMQHQLAHRLNQTWLDMQLQANSKPHVFVFGHEPAFRALPRYCLDKYPARRDAFWRSLTRAGARTYFCGHDHFYDHARIDDGDADPGNDLHQFIVGTAGAYPYIWVPPYDGNNGDFTPEQVHHAERFGYVLVDIDDLDVTVTWMERRDNNLYLPGVYKAGEVWSYRVSPGLAVLYPRGGGRIVAGQPYTIQWKTTEGAEVKRVLIEYSLDGGAGWAAMDEVDNTGAYTWLTPSVNSDLCLVRVSDVRDPTVSDTSDAVFSISACQAKLTADLNGDCYVDFADLALLAAEWLACGNPLDPACGTRP